MALLCLFIFALNLLPTVANAQNDRDENRGFVVCSGLPGDECSLEKLVTLVNKILGYLVKISVPIAAGAFAYAGFILMTTGVSDRRSEAKELFKKVFIGFVIMLAAWLIVGTISRAIFRPDINDAVQLNK